MASKAINTRTSPNIRQRLERLRSIQGPKWYSLGDIVRVVLELGLRSAESMVAAAPNHADTMFIELVGVERERMAQLDGRRKDGVQTTKAED